MSVYKKCSACKISKTIGQFYKQKCGMIGRTGECKECRKARTAAFTKKNREHKNRINREWYARNKEKVRLKNKAWYDANPGYQKHRRRQLKVKSQESNE